MLITVAYLQGETGHRGAVAGAQPARHQRIHHRESRRLLELGLLTKRTIRTIRAASCSPSPRRAARIEKLVPELRTIITRSSPGQCALVRDAMQFLEQLIAGSEQVMQTSPAC